MYKKNAYSSSYLVQTILPTPIFNIADLSSIFGGKDGSSLLTDNQGHIRALELIAFPNTTLIVEKKITMGILQVRFLSYPLYPLFIDERFVRFQKEDSIQCPAPISDPQRILSNCQKLLGTPYLWGGNYSQGVPELLSFFPPPKTLQQKNMNKWMLKGVDCSGLLYEATNGLTPRNTSQMFSFGCSVLKGKMSLDEILKTIHPLDLILCPGHVMIIENKDTIIESRASIGKVIRADLKKRLTEIIQNSFSQRLKPFKKTFDIRHWITIDS